MKRLSFFLLPALLIFSCKKDNPTLPSGLDCSKVTIQWSATISRTITNSCATSNCHDGTAGQPDLRTYAQVKAIADNGKLHNRVVRDKDMPSSGTFTQAQRDSIECWIQAGAPQN